jgi:hypothetical protein
MPIVSQVLDAGVMRASSRTIRRVESTKNAADKAARMYLAGIAMSRYGVKKPLLPGGRRPPFK